MFNSSDFDRMIFPIHGKALSSVKNLPASLLHIPDDKARYIIYLHDRNSPLNDKSANIPLPRRKEIACELADMYEDVVINNQDQKVLSCIVDLARSMDDKKFSLLLAAEETFYEYYSNILSPVFAMESAGVVKETLETLDKKMRLLNYCDQLEKKITEYKRDLFGEDETLIKAVRVSPEQMASVSKNQRR